MDAIQGTVELTRPTVVAIWPEHSGASPVAHILASEITLFTGDNGRMQALAKGELVRVSQDGTTIPLGLEAANVISLHKAGRAIMMGHGIENLRIP